MREMKLFRLVGAKLAARIGRARGYLTTGRASGASDGRRVRRDDGYRWDRASRLWRVARWLGQGAGEMLDIRRREAEVLFRRIGITFAVYGEADAQERLIPFDVFAAHFSLHPNGISLRAGLSSA